MENNKQTTAELLEEQIRETLNDLSVEHFGNEQTTKPILEKLRTLNSQHMELMKLENDIALRKQELELELKKLETETALKSRELDIKENDSKANNAIEEQKIKEQKKQNMTNAIIGGVTAGTGIAGIIATLHCFKKSMQFEETGSYTNKTAQHVGGLFNLFKRKG